MNKIMEIIMRLLKSNSLSNDVANELSEAISAIDLKEEAKDEQNSRHMDVSIDDYEAETLVLMEGHSKAAIRRIGKERATFAKFYQNKCYRENNRKEAKEWGSLVYTLQNIK